MATSEKSWDGIEIMIFGRKPGQAMDLEQTIAIAMPGIEVLLESYENYGDALDHCKMRRAVGFLLMIEDAEVPGVGEVFRNLTNPFSGNGWNALGALVHDDAESFVGYRALQSNKQLIDYLPRSAFSTETDCRATMQGLWQQFSQAFEAQLLPQALQESIIATALKHDRQGSLAFYEQINNLLTTNLALSWKERFALKWYCAVEFANAQEPAVLEPHQTLQKFIKSIQASDPMPQLETSRLKDQTISLGTRVLELVHGLTRARTEGKLNEFLDSLIPFARPGSPAILRTVVQQRQTILGFAGKLRAVG